MARLPQPGSDNGTWGDILNDYLSQSLKSDGTIKDDAVTTSAIAPNAITAAEIAPNAVTANKIAADAVTATQIQDGSVNEAQLSSGVQTKLNSTLGDDGVADLVGDTDSATREALDGLYLGGGAPTYAEYVGDGTTGPFTITHNMNTRDVDVLVYDRLTYEQILVANTRPTPDTVLLSPDEAWNSGACRVVVKWLGQSDVTAPSAPTMALASKTMTSISVSLSGESDAGDGIDYYDYYINGTQVASGQGTTYTYAGLASNTSYNLHATVIDKAGNISTASNTLSLSTDGVAAPTAPTLALTGSTSTTLSVSASGATGDISSYSYYIDNALAASGQSATYTYIGLSPSTSYSLHVIAVGPGGSSLSSNSLTQSTSAAAAAIQYLTSGGTRNASNGDTVTLSGLVVPGDANRYMVVWASTAHAAWLDATAYATTLQVSTDAGSSWSDLGARAGAWRIGNSGQGQGGLVLWLVPSPPSGTLSLRATLASSATETNTQIAAQVFSGVASAGTPIVSGTGGTTGNVNMSIPSATGDFTVFGCIAGDPGGANPTGYNHTLRYSAGNNAVGLGQWLNVGDAAGAATVSHTLTTALKRVAVGVNLTKV